MTGKHKKDKYTEAEAIENFANESNEDVYRRKAVLYRAASKDSGKLYSDVIACNVFDETIMYWDDYARELIGQSLDTYMNAGYTIEEAIDRICYKGTSYVEFWFLTPLSDYYVYAFAVSLDGEVISDVFTDVFTTGEES